MFLVDMDTPGVTVGEPIHTVDSTIPGGHPHVYFEDVVVDEAAVLGEPGKGFEYAQVRLGPARLTHCMRRSEERRVGKESRPGASQGRWGKKERGQIRSEARIDKRNTHTTSKELLTVS